MLPPSDSFAHQNLKLAEALAGIRKQTAAPAPPPPYAAAASSASAELLGEFEDEDDDSLPLAPIVIKIDTSISIDGQNNTVAIPTSMGSGVEDNQSPASDVPSPSTSTGLSMQQLQQRRQAKSAQLASTIISALKSAGALDDKETGRQRPIEVDVNAGIRITGNSNLICSGTRRKAGQDSVSTLALPAERLGRKRRAQSEPLGAPDLKRAHTTRESAGP
ncbi:hypothetical protein FQN49_006686 [Arthroderma sp. PD_2]|nr:hypothetical protein FQN49_006686 [Arthroderma sp. PD_2]